jgi:PadR family transcriptional regulator PadR
MAAEPSDPIVASHFQELRRGTVVLACLLVLDEPRYGYALLRTLGDAGLDVEANTLYPLLRRLEAQGLLTSLWNTDEARPRKFYKTTEQGDAIAETLRTEWARLDRAIADLNAATTIPGGEK